MIATDLDLAHMRHAIEWSRRCPSVPDAFNVGAVVVDAYGGQLAYGYSRETDSYVHAEESALAKLAGVDLRDAAIYSTLEPCSVRASRPLPCTQLILRAGIPRVYFALREPLLLADCEGVELLAAAGVQVVELPQFAADVVAINGHLIRR
ncbi:dCMP deaminase [Catellatospora tritici]|uniref:dCMP deaminase n=1 Tax=Catellatospora tritici TaxID=2851566 RepID=UPI0020C37656|nr:dCMP deaminase [Catellatospora tritici]